jgi:stress-induced morphogen
MLTTRQWWVLHQEKHISGMRDTPPPFLQKKKIQNSKKRTHMFLSFKRVNIVSEAFKSKMQPARHRMVYTLLKDELAAEGGIHALQLKTRTPEEEEKAKARDV